MKDHYHTLGISTRASKEDIRAAYRRLAMKYHPDKSGGDPNSEERFKEINEAYHVLSDPDKKRSYDYYQGLGDSSYSQYSSSNTGSSSAGSTYSSDPYVHMHANYMPKDDGNSQQYAYNNPKNLPYANLVLALGVCSIFGCFCFGVVGLLCSLLAIFISGVETKRFKTNGLAYTGQSYIAVRAGRVMAFVGMVLSLLWLIVMFLS